MKGLSRRTWAWVAVAWIACLMVGSLMPFEAKLALGTRPGRPKHRQDRVFSVKHRAFHWMTFGLAAFWLLLLARKQSEELAYAGATLGLGVLLEFVQHWVYYGPVEWWDMEDDGYGILAALLVVQLPRLKSALVRQVSSQADQGQLPLPRGSV